MPQIPIEFCRASSISDIPQNIIDGRIYFIYDENKIVLDMQDKRVIFQGMDASVSNEVLIFGAN